MISCSFLYLLLLLLLFRSARAQQCGEQWTSFVVRDDSNTALLSVDKASGKTSVKTLEVDGVDVGKRLAVLSSQLEALQAELDAVKADEAQIGVRNVAATAATSQSVETPACNEGTYNLLDLNLIFIFSFYSFIRV